MKKYGKLLGAGCALIMALGLLGACGSSSTGASTSKPSTSTASSNSSTNANKTTTTATSSAATTNSSSTASAASFYKGKTLNVIVPYGPGGGYDQWARLLSPYLQKYLGVAKVDVLNQPGGGGLVGTNKLYAAKPDGLTIGDTNAGGDVFDQIAGTTGVSFDVSKMNWIGRPDNDPHVIAVPGNSKYNSFNDLMKLKGTKTVLKSLATGKGSSDYNAAVITFNAFKIPFTMVAAFSGSKAEKAAFLQGSGDTTSLSASDVLQMGNKAKVVVLTAAQPFDKLPNTPTVLDEAKKAGLSSGAVTALTNMSDVMSLGHAFVAPPGVPADRISALQDAFKKAMNDPKFVAQAKKSNLYVGFEGGQQLQKIAKDAVNNGSVLKSYLKTN